MRKIGWETSLAKMCGWTEPERVHVVKHDPLQALIDSIRARVDDVVMPLCFASSAIVLLS